jgi:4-hydroxybenzoate polyprenyltransferase
MAQSGPAARKRDPAFDAAPEIGPRFESPRAKGLRAKGRALHAYARLLRPHQWAKNLLVFVALATSHRFTPQAFLQAALAFAAFSLCASGAYILNDWVDVAADRGHPFKRNRPLASGAVPIAHGLAIAPLLLAASAGLALLAPPGFGLALAAYAAANVAYSLYLKRKMMVDVATLAGLYTVRVIAGAAAIGVPISEWLLAFSMFIFLALALVKRHSEIAMRMDAGLPDPSNRDYRAADLPVLIVLSAASGYAAVVVFALYVSSPALLSLYRHPHWLYLICPLLLYWISRVILRSNRREMPDDPVVFALKDRASFLTMALLGVVAAAAAYL